MPSFFRRMKFILNLRRLIPFLYDFFKSSEVPPFRKAVSILLIVGYLVFPFDLIPDYLVGLGIIDDLAVLAFILQRIVQMAPPSLKKKHFLK